jgi:hypothetical protein
MSRLSAISAKPVIQEYAQGAAQSAISAVADFLAPTVEVAVSTGKYKSYSAKSRFRIPNTKRAMGGEASILQMDRADADYSCAPHALDAILDDLEIQESQGVDLLMENADELAAIAALAHEKDVIDAALAAAGNGTGKNFNSVDAPDTLNEAILAVAKAAAYGSTMGIGIIFGPAALRNFFRNTGTRAMFPGAASIAPTMDNVSKCLWPGVESRVSMMVSDTAPEGKASSLDFMLDTSVLIFARLAKPTRRDPSFMKTFRLRGQWMKPSAVRLADDRGERIKFDWSEDVRVTNSAAVQRLVISWS